MLDGPLVHSRCGNSQHTIGGQTRNRLVDVVAFRQDIFPHEMARDVAVLVLLLLVLALHGDGVLPRGFDGDFVGGELLHVQVDLELVLVEADGRAGVLGRCCSSPWSVVARGSAQEGS